MEEKEELMQSEINIIVNRIIEASKVDNSLFKNNKYNPISTILWNEVEVLLEENKYIGKRELIEQLLLKVEPELKLIEIEKTANRTKNIYVIKFCVVFTFILCIISMFILFSTH